MILIEYFFYVSPPFSALISRGWKIAVSAPEREVSRTNSYTKIFHSNFSKILYNQVLGTSNTQPNMNIELILYLGIIRV